MSASDPDPEGPGLAPPLPHVVRASVTHKGAELLVPLTRDEHQGYDTSVDFALAFSKKAEAAVLCESLGQALARFPACAGRFVKRDVVVEGKLDKEVRLCIICNNAGVAFRARPCEGVLPPLANPLPPGLFDRAIGTRPAPNGGPGQGPLFRVRLLDFEDGQLMALSFARGLTDIAGMGVFLRVWASLHRGEDPAPPPALDRIRLEAAVNYTRPRVAVEFSRLHRRASSESHPGLPGSPVVSFLVGSEELHSLSTSLSDTCRRKRLIYDSETLLPQEAVLALVAESARGALPASLWLDYRETFGVELHLGTAGGLVDLDFPRDLESIVAAIRKHPLAAQSRDFWAWKSAQPKGSFGAGLVLDQWLEALNLELLDFGAGSAAGAGLATSFWQSIADAPDERGGGCVVLLPQGEGIAVQALLPKAAVARLSAKHQCTTWHPQ